MRLKGEAASVQFGLELGYSGFQGTPPDRDAKLADPKVHELVVGPAGPFVRGYRRIGPRSGSGSFQGYDRVGRHCRRAVYPGMARGRMLVAVSGFRGAVVYPVP